MLALLLAASLAAPDPPAAAAAEPDEVLIGETELNGWALKAVTFVQHNKDSQPSIAGMRCEAKRNGLVVQAYRDAGFGIEVRGHHPDEEGDEYGYVNIERLDLDGTRYEARWGMRGVAWYFSDVPDPKPPAREPDPPGTLISTIPIIELPTGLLVVRRPGEVEWHHTTVLADELLRARRLRIWFRGDFWYRDDSAPLQTAEVPLEGLPPALAWCREAMASKRAILLRPDQATTKGTIRGP